METTNTFLIFFIVILGYFLGSIPTGYLAGRWYAGIDLRQIGSGSTGATNVFRHVGKWPAIIVFLVDLTKGILPVLAANHLLNNDLMLVIAGLASLSGHIWSIWLKGKGGKAVATGLGMLLGLAWPVGMACFGIFLTIFSVSKIVSLSSIIAAISLPVLMALSFPAGQFNNTFFYFSLITMLMVLWRHRSNFKRLLAGKEQRITHSK